MESRQNTVLAASIAMPILPGLLVLWRLYNNLVVKRFLRVADVLIFCAMVSDVAALASSGRSAVYGLGKHFLDPTFTPAAKVQAMRYIWYGEVMNLLAMFFAKLSIATFLLYLDFAKKYKIIMWVSVALIVIINGASSMVSVLAACDPIALNWDKSLPGTCWPRSVNTIAGYVQSSFNMVTDIIFSAAPILYLSTVQLPRRVQWGLRIVFLIGVFATVCSILKLTQLKVLENTMDPTWYSVDLTVWSTAEVNVAIFAACLPPLRSQFDLILRRFVGTTLKSSQGRMSKTVSFALQHRTKTGTEIRTGTGVHNNDYGSESSILPPHGDDHGIMKTVNVRVSDEEDQTPSLDYGHNFGDNRENHHGYVETGKIT